MFFCTITAAIKLVHLKFTVAAQNIFLSSTILKVTTCGATSYSKVASLPEALLKMVPTALFYSENLLLSTASFIKSSSVETLLYFVNMLLSIAWSIKLASLKFLKIVPSSSDLLHCSQNMLITTASYIKLSCLKALKKLSSPSSLLSQMYCSIVSICKSCKSAPTNFHKYIQSDQIKSKIQKSKKTGKSIWKWTKRVTRVSYLVLSTALFCIHCIADLVQVVSSELVSALFYTANVCAEDKDKIVVVPI